MKRWFFGLQEKGYTSSGKLVFAKVASTGFLDNLYSKEQVCICSTNQQDFRNNK